MANHRSRKRARAESEDGATAASQSVSSSTRGSSKVPHDANNSGLALVPKAEDQEYLPKEKDSDFWLENGSVILVARNVEFRVYGGLLADHSPVLKVLFKKYKHITRSVSFDGHYEAMCPVVHLEDSPEDLRHMLRMYMPRRDTR